jgi:hypothetical protein
MIRVCVRRSQAPIFAREIHRHNPIPNSGLILKRISGTLQDDAVFISAQYLRYIYDT